LYILVDLPKLSPPSLSDILFSKKSAIIAS
jgi:hypothetical protein